MHLHRQFAANFYAIFPAGTTFGPDGDVDAFYLPPFNDEFGKPCSAAALLRGVRGPSRGAGVPVLRGQPGVRERARQAGSYISANRGLQTENASSADPADGARDAAGSEDTTFRFDASDLMPAAVGSDAEWTEFTAWITGQDDATTLANIDAAWPAN